MTPRRRKTLAFALSMVLHGIPLGWGLLTFSPDLETPEIEFEFQEVEMIDPDALQAEAEQVPEGAAVVEPPPEPAKQEPEEPEEEPSEDEDEADAEHEQEEAPTDDQSEQESNVDEENGKPTEVDQLAPKTSTLYMLLANERIRSLPFAGQGVEIMAPLPDFQFIIQGGGFNTLQDFDYMVVATSDVRDWTQTFVAVESNLPRAKLKAGIERAVAERGEVIEWTDSGGYLRGNPRPQDPNRPDVDPRWFVFLENDIAVYVRDEFLPSILKGPEGTRDQTSGNFVANLTRMREFAATDPDLGMQAKFKDLRSALKNIRGIPFDAPDDIEVSADATVAPTLVIRFRFAGEADAEAFVEFWNGELEEIVKSDWKIKLMAGWMYDLAKIEQQGPRVILRGEFTRGQAEEVLDLLADFSRRALGKTAEEMEADRIERERAWARRQADRASSPDAEGSTAAPGETTPPGSDENPETPGTPGGETPPTPAPEGEQPQPAELDAPTIPREPAPVPSPEADDDG